MEVMKNYAHATMQGIWNQIGEIKFFVSRMYGLAVIMSLLTSTASKNIDKI